MTTQPYETRPMTAAEMFPVSTNDPFYPEYINAGRAQRNARREYMRKEVARCCIAQGVAVRTFSRDFGKVSYSFHGRERMSRLLVALDLLRLHSLPYAITTERNAVIITF